MNSEEKATIEDNSRPAPIRDWILPLARAGWIAATLLTLGLDVIGIPFAYAKQVAICISPACDPDALTPDKVQALQSAGLSAGFWASYETAISVVTTLVYVSVAAVIFLRKSPTTASSTTGAYQTQRMALFTAFMLVTFGGAAFTGTMQAIPDFHPGMRLPVYLLDVAGQVSFYTFFCLFPNGRFVPRWTRWVCLIWAVVWLMRLFPALDAIAHDLTDGLPFLAFLATLVVAQVYRYRRVSDPVQRQQTKWVVFGFSLGLVGFASVLVIGNTLLYNLQSDPVVELVGGTFIYIFLLIIPISIGVAILRSRLYDIDVIINRALVYGSLTGMLALVYLGSVVLLQGSLAGVTGQGHNDLAIVVSTLAIAALFMPLRRRIQSVIDRRFYRRKYDATRTLANFSQAVRDEVDLDQLAGRLLEAVQETMQPANISLWLRPGHAPKSVAFEPEEGR